MRAHALTLATTLALGLATAHAGPADLAAVDASRRAAEAERDPGRAAVAWRAAARGYDAIADDATAADADRDRATMEAVLAWQEADRRARDVVRGPVGLNGDDLAQFAAALDRYLARAPDDGPRRVQVRYARARLRDRAGAIDAAIVDYRAAIAGDPSGDVAGFAAMMVLDALHRAGREADVIATAREFLADRALLAAHPEVAATARAIDFAGHRLAAEDAERRARAGDRRAFAACADDYARAAAVAPDRQARLEAQYDRGVCAARAGDEATADAAWRLVVDDGGGLATIAHARLVQLAVHRGDLAAAVPSLAALARAAVSAVASAQPAPMPQAPR